ncbi:hypothetical protein [Rahnella sikkimica]|uniref:Uncharacterized protein n=1 Tax=Rahnella sikkimica TaxID=1805933 RepID=A0A2L1UNB7_9GAMM|nr:hypothetical protein [Rahnella sikkimica]AVF34411.1 hypothetical protein BV494_05490 [Rahnella sikkimica]
MGWSVPKAPVPEKAAAWSPWICVFILGAGFLASLAWVVLNSPADGLPALASGFYLPLTGYALAGTLFFLTLYLLGWEIQALYWHNALWWQHNTSAAWQRWAQNSLCVVKVVMLTPDSQLLLRKAGIEKAEASDDAADMPKVLFPEETLIPGINRFERLCHALLDEIAPTLNTTLKNEDVSVYLQTSREVDEAEQHKLYSILAERFPAKKFSVHLLPDSSLFPIWNQSVLASHHPVLLLAMHYRKPHETLSEIATALLLVPPTRLKAAEAKTATRLFRAMPVKTDRLASELTEQRDMQQQPAESIRLVWFSGLADSVRQKLSALIYELKLPLRPSAPMGGLVDFDKDNDQYGALTGGLLMGAAALMVEQGQGGQWIIHHDGKNAWTIVVGDQAPVSLQPAENLPQAPYPAGSVALSLLFNLVLFWCLGNAWPHWLFSCWGFTAIVFSLFITLPGSVIALRTAVNKIQKPQFMQDANASLRD